MRGRVHKKGRLITNSVSNRLNKREEDTFRSAIKTAFSHSPKKVATASKDVQDKQEISSVKKGNHQLKL